MDTYCISPLRIRSNKKVPDSPFIDVPCGQCLNCQQRRRMEWSFRLENELKHSSTASFVTLTHDDHKLIVDSLSKPLIQQFLKRLRYWVANPHRFMQIYDRIYKGTLHPFKAKVREIEEKRPNLRYFISGEYGGLFGRCHYHMIIFNLPENDTYKCILWHSWGLGITHFGDVNPASISYTAKYCLKELSGRTDEFMLCSKGIGSNYTQEMGEYHRRQKTIFGVKQFGEKTRLPTYYRDKIFTPGKKKALIKNTIKEIEKKQKVKSEKFEKRGENEWLAEFERIKQNIQAARLKYNQKNNK